jgi:hypothetical protein
LRYLILSALVGFLVACQDPTAVSTGGTASSRSLSIDYGDALATEVNYITQCSWTKANPKSWSVPADSLPGYGAINESRIGNSWADWVEPGASTMGVVGLMVGYNRVVALGKSNPTLDYRVQTALSGFFWSWVRNQANQIDVGNTAFPTRLYYRTDGTLDHKDDASGVVTAQVLIAMRQYCRLSPNGDRATYEAEEYPLAKRMAQYIDGHLSTWTLDKSYGVAAFHGFANWARNRGESATAKYYDDRAQAFSDGLAQAQDTGSWRNYYSYLDGNTGVYCADNQGVAQMDQTGFAPYEFNARPRDEVYARDLAYWWDHGAAFGGVTPTVQWGPYAGGVHQKIPELQTKAYPGDSFQLADAEWKIAHANGNQNDQYKQAWAHYNFALSPLGSSTGSGCWVNTADFDGFQGGFIDWVDNNGQRPDSSLNWERFVDTSGYMAVATEELVYSSEVDWGS